MSPADESTLPTDSKHVARFSDIANFMRAPFQPDPTGLDIAMAGVPFDMPSNRGGARHGPAQMREMSRLIRRIHFATRMAPFEVCRVADVGDAPVNPYDPSDESLAKITTFFDRIVEAGALPLVAGGDHTITLPVMRAVAKKHGTLGMLHFDAHPDTHDELLGNKYNHATCFRRAIEEGVLDPKRHVMVGIRGTLFSADDLDWALDHGITIIDIDTFYDLGVAETIATARRVLGDGPSYITFDIDGMDPIYAPGTGAPEPGGLMMRDAQLILRGMRGLDLYGADVNEVSPPLDPTGLTANVANNLMFEELCLLADAVDRRRAK